MTELLYHTSLADLQTGALPHWWQKDNPASQLAIVLAAVAALADELAAEGEGIFADMSLATARDAALRSEWAPLYGAGAEQQPMNTEQLRQYLQARTAEDGSVASLENTLLALLRNDLNDGADPLTLDATFPADGSGLTLSTTPGLAPERGYLVFGVDGSGITLNTTFPERGRVEIVERFTDSRVDVNVRSWLAFDRPAFARAVERFRQAHLYPSIITED
jgi:hypothetical protein